MDMDMDKHKHIAITNDHELYLYLLRMCDLRTAKFGLVVVFLFFLRVAGWWALALPVLGDLGLPLEGDPDRIDASPRDRETVVRRIGCCGVFYQNASVPLCTTPKLLSDILV